MKDLLIVVLIIVVAVFGVIYGFSWLDKHDPLTHGSRITALRNGDYSYFAPEVQTHGNRSFVPLGLQAAPSYYSVGIGKIVEGFHQTHPKLKVVSWGVDWKMTGHDVSSIHSFWVDGIWIEHAAAK